MHSWRTGSSLYSTDGQNIPELSHEPVAIEIRISAHVNILEVWNTHLNGKTLLWSKGLAQLWFFSLIISLLIWLFVVPGIKAGRQHFSASLLNFKSIMSAFKWMLLVYMLFELHVQESLIPCPVSLWYKHGYVDASTGCISLTRNTWTQHCFIWVGFGKGDFGFGNIYLSFISGASFIQKSRIWNFGIGSISNFSFWG